MAIIAADPSTYPALKQAKKKPTLREKLVSPKKIASSNSPANTGLKKRPPAPVPSAPPAVGRWPGSPGQPEYRAGVKPTWSDGVMRSTDPKPVLRDQLMRSTDPPSVLQRLSGDQAGGPGPAAAIATGRPMGPPSGSRFSMRDTGDGLDDLGGHEQRMQVPQYRQLQGASVSLHAKETARAAYLNLLYAKQTGKPVDLDALAEAKRDYLASIAPTTAAPIPAAPIPAASAGGVGRDTSFVGTPSGSRASISPGLGNGSNEVASYPKRPLEYGSPMLQEPGQPSRPLDARPMATPENVNGPVSVSQPAQRADAMMSTWPRDRQVQHQQDRMDAGYGLDPQLPQPPPFNPNPSPSYRPEWSDPAQATPTVPAMGSGAPPQPQVVPGAATPPQAAQARRVDGQPVYPQGGQPNRPPAMQSIGAPPAPGSQAAIDQSFGDSLASSPEQWQRYAAQDAQQAQRPQTLQAQLEGPPQAPPQSQQARTEGYRQLFDAMPSGSLPSLTDGEGNFRAPMGADRHMGSTVVGGRELGIDPMNPGDYRGPLWKQMMLRGQRAEIAGKQEKMGSQWDPSMLSAEKDPATGLSGRDMWERMQKMAGSDEAVRQRRKKFREERGLRKMMVRNNAKGDMLARKERIRNKQMGVGGQNANMMAMFNRNPRLAMQYMQLQQGNNLAREEMRLRSKMHEGTLTQRDRESLARLDEQRMRLASEDARSRRVPYGGEVSLAAGFKEQFPKATDREIQQRVDDYNRRYGGGGAMPGGPGGAQPQPSGPSPGGQKGKIPMWARDVSPEELVQRGQQEEWPDSAINGLLQHIYGVPYANVAYPRGAGPWGITGRRIVTGLKGLGAALTGDTSIWGNENTDIDAQTRGNYVRPGHNRVRTREQAHWSRRMPQ